MSQDLQENTFIEKFCEILENTIFTEQLRAAVSEYL